MTPSDYSARARKAWLTRKRNAEAARVASDASAAVVVSQGDYLSEMPTRRAETREVESLLRLGAGDEMFTAMGPGKFGEAEVAKQQAGLNVIRKALRDAPPDLPVGALDGMTAIESATAGEMEFGEKMVPGQVNPEVVIVSSVGVVGDYAGDRKRIRLNADILTREGRQGREASAALAHEIGHNAQLSKITDEALAQWKEISGGGSKCRISDHGRTNHVEHFAEAFAAYSMNDSLEGFTFFPEHHRERLRQMEPQVFAFMERLWRDPSMWRKKGDSKYERARTLDWR